MSEQSPYSPPDAENSPCDNPDIIAGFNPDSPRTIVAFSQPGAVFHSLTPREVEVLNLIKQGLTSKEIGQQLSITTTTVRTHRRNIPIKLGVKNAKSAAINPQEDLDREGINKRSFSETLVTHPLTKREIEVLNLIKQGHTDNEIGKKLYISPRTATKNRETSYRKLKATSSVEAVITGIEIGAIDPQSALEGTDADITGFTQLSPAEMRVLQAFVSTKGGTNQKIGHKTFTSSKTIESHFRHIYKKTRTANKAQLITAAIVYENQLPKTKSI